MAKKSNFDFLAIIQFQRSQFIKIFKNMKLDYQEIMKVKLFKTWKFFLSVFIHDNFITSCQSFTKMQDDSRKTSNLKVIYLNEI